MLSTVSGGEPSFVLNSKYNGVLFNGGGQTFKALPSYKAQRCESHHSLGIKPSGSDFDSDSELFILAEMQKK